MKLIPASDWPDGFGCLPCRLAGRSSEAAVIADDEDDDGKHNYTGMCGNHAELLDEEEEERDE